MLDAGVSGNILLTLIMLMVPLVGIMMAITPYLMKKNECFAVTVPESAMQDPYLKGLKRRYTTIVLLITLTLILLGVACIAFGYEPGLFIVIIAGTLVLCLGSYVLMLYFRQKVRLYKKEKNWQAEEQEAIAFVSEKPIPKAISLKWTLLYLPIIVITLVIGYAGYESMPDQVPLQMNFEGQVTNSIEKSPFVIWFPVLIQLFIIGSMVFSHWTIARSKRLSSPQAPVTSALAYGMFAHAQSIYLLAAGLLIAGLMIMIPLSFIGSVGLLQAGAVVAIGAMVLVVGALAISIVYGQGGARLFAQMKDSQTLAADDDRYWKFGIFYYNPEDPSLFLLERFGVGWTVNWARPLVWLIFAAGFVITIGFIVVVTAIA